jgi:hypothetical protein
MRRGHGLLIALLLSLVLGPGAAAASDTRQRGFTQSDVSSHAASVRVLKRTSEDRDDEAGPLLEPPAPRVVTAQLELRPAGTPFVPAAAEPRQARPSSYRARAPPASIVL